VKDGVYTLMIGDPEKGTTLDADDWDGTEQRWMTVAVNTEADMTPRLRVGSVPFALRARDADTLLGSPPAAFAAAVHTHAAAQVTDFATEVNTTIGPLGNANPKNHNRYTDAEAVSAAEDSALFATAGHNHDTAYSALSHDHNTAYSALSHNHNAAYSALSHDHNAAYSALGHGHAGSDLTSAVPYARLPVGASASTVAAGDDPRFPKAARVSSLKVKSVGCNFCPTNCGLCSTRSTLLDGVEKRPDNNRGLSLVVIQRSTHAVTFQQTYDTHGASAQSDALAAKLNALDDTSIVVLTNSDAFSGALNAAAQDALLRCGASPYVRSPTNTRDDYVLVGLCGRGAGSGLEIHRASEEGPAEVSLMLSDGDVLGAPPTMPTRGYAWSNSKRAFSLTQNGPAGWKKMTNFDDLAFTSRGNPMFFYVSMQMNDDVGISTTGEWLAQACRLQIDNGTAGAQQILLAQKELYAKYNFEWDYTYGTVVPLTAGKHTVFLECDQWRSANGMNSSVGNRGFEDPFAIGGTTAGYQDVFLAFEIG
jgi:hypothetical protein